VLQCVTVCCPVLQDFPVIPVIVCCSVLQCVVVSYSVLYCVAINKIPGWSAGAKQPVIPHVKSQISHTRTNIFNCVFDPPPFLISCSCAETRTHTHTQTHTHTHTCSRETGQINTEWYWHSGPRSTSTGSVPLFLCTFSV